MRGVGGIEMVLDFEGVYDLSKLVLDLEVVNLLSKFSLSSPFPNLQHE